MWKRISASVLAATVVVGVAGTAAAQGLIPTVIGATVANASRSRGGCDQSFLKDPTYIGRRGAELDKLMAKYATASAASTKTDARQAGKIFSDFPEGGEFGADKQVHPATTFSLSGERPAQAPNLVRQSVALGGDGANWFARGVWRVEPAGATTGGSEGALFYAADFRQDPFWGSWRIWRIRAYDKAADLPRMSDAFCEFASIGALW